VLALVRYAEASGIVLLLPRLATSAASASRNAPDVARGCWDVFGQLGGAKYTLQAAPHMAPLGAMISALGGGTGAARFIPAAPAAAPAAVPVLRKSSGGLAAAAELPRLNIDPDRVTSQGESSGGDMAVQFHLAFSAAVKGVCGADAQPFRCAATRFDGDALLPQVARGAVGCERSLTGLTIPHLAAVTRVVDAALHRLRAEHDHRVYADCGSNLGLRLAVCLD